MGSVDPAKVSPGAKEVRALPKESLLAALRNRVLQGLARSLPGSFTLRVQLHRWRGVKIGKRVHISPDVILETAYPQWISIGDHVQIGIRVTVLAHIHGMPPRKADWEDYVSVRIEDEAFVGPGVMILPNVTVGRGAVITAGSVVTQSVPPMTMVQGNPAKPIAQCGVPLAWDTPLKEFLRHLKPIGR
jgi:acetyltransferase-like isoleucine patch superfamily enzyme